MQQRGQAEQRPADCDFPATMAQQLCFACFGANLAVVNGVLVCEDCGTQCQVRAHARAARALHALRADPAAAWRQQQQQQGGCSLAAAPAAVQQQQVQA